MNEYALRQRKPTRFLMNLGIVIVLHALLLWAISSGLAHKFVKIVKGPVEAVLLEETKPDIPPPPPPPPPKNLPPPPAYVPPVEVQVSTPPPANAIAAVSNKPQAEAPPSPLPVVSNAPPAPPAPIARTAAVISASSCEKPDYPSASRRLEEEGTVTLKFLVGVDGKVKESAVEKSSGFKRLDEAARQGLSKCQFKPGTENGQPVEGWANIKYAWKMD
jgi:periplasmic protein TonB